MAENTYKFCQEKGEMTSASKYCKQCKVYDCDQCSIIHTNSMSCESSHTIITDQEHHQYIATGGELSDNAHANDVITQPCSDTLEEILLASDHELSNINKLCGAEGEPNTVGIEPESRPHRGNSFIEYDERICKTSSDEKKCNSALKCESCEKSEIAQSFCNECNEFLCSPCSNYHEGAKQTSHHSIISLYDQSRFSPTLTCALSECIGKSEKAFAYCIECQQPELLCATCAARHLAQNLTRGHKLCTDLDHYESLSIQRKYTNSSTEEDPDVTNVEVQRLSPCKHLQEKYIQVKPGKPYCKSATIDSITLEWSSPCVQQRSSMYQVMYKNWSEMTEWKTYEQLANDCTLNVTNMKAGDRYTFKVAVINDINQVGPFSDESDDIFTIQSAALNILGTLMTVDKKCAQVIVKRLPIRESARNVQFKCRRLVIGDEPRIPPHEKTIILLGATGTGKSTLVDGLVNYVFGVKWTDSFRLTLENLEQEEKLNSASQAMSQTEWITCYSILPVTGSRINYKLNIVDTPGFGDVRGLERDKSIVDQIRNLLMDREIGIIFVDAVCLLVKSSDSRLTPTQKYIFNSMTSLFQNDIEENICTLITFSDGENLPVLDALKEANLPSKHYFCFNNSCLFAQNIKMENLSRLFWDMGHGEFAKLFQHFNELSTKCLEKSKQVLIERERIEITINNLNKKLDIGLSMIKNLMKKIEILQRNSEKVERNKDFVYTENKYRKTITKSSTRNTNCHKCETTCHENCNVKPLCMVTCPMMSMGYCTQCPGKCSIMEHYNENYIYKMVIKVETKTFADMKRKYVDATIEKCTNKSIIQNMERELLELEWDITTMLLEITNSNNKLKEIALRSDPLSAVEHIDCLIESEKIEKREGYQHRIAALQKCRTCAEHGKKVSIFEAQKKKCVKHSCRQISCQPCFHHLKLYALS